MLSIPPPPPAAVLVVDGSDLPALSKAVSTCDRPTVAKAVEGETGRHGAFLVQAFEEQAEIAQARLDLAERRRVLRSSTPGVAAKLGDTEQALTVTAAAIDDRQRALDDARALDKLKQDAMGWFRQQFIIQCQGRGA